MCKEMNKIEFEKFQNEMARLSQIKYTSYEKTLKEIGISYIAECNHSTKLMHNQQYNMLTYGLYLASSDASGINVCPKSSMCREACLVGSGYAKIDGLAGNSTVIIISHRITTLMHADNIIVLDKGRVAQSGSHDKLLEQDGIYKKIYDIQMQGI